MKLRLSVVFTAAMVLLFLFATVTALDFAYYDRTYPLLVGAFGSVLAIVELASQLRRRDKPGKAEQQDVADLGVDKSLLTKAAYGRAGVVAGWFLGLYLGIWLVGARIAVTLWLLLFLRIKGRNRWLTSVVMTAVTVILVFGVLGKMMDIYWPTGLLQSHFALPQFLQ